MAKLTREEAIRRWNAAIATKRATVAKMQKSLEEDYRQAEGEKPVSASRFYGAWDDADFDMSADRMNRHINESRTFKDDIDAF